MLERKEALASLSRRLKSETFDQPLSVVAIAEFAQCGLQLFEVLEVPHPEKLLFEGAEEAFNAAIGLGRQLHRIVTAELQPSR